MAVITQKTYAQMALGDPERHWELHDGQLREKPPMSFAHNDTMVRLGLDLGRQLDPRAYAVRINTGRVLHTEHQYFVPDIFVVPLAYLEPLWSEPNLLEAYEQPLPLIIEVWSPSTGGYDVDAKLPTYQRRGDEEIWRLHPFEHTLTIWRRQHLEHYEEEVIHGGLVSPSSLPNVTIDLDALFGFLDDRPNPLR